MSQAELGARTHSSPRQSVRATLHRVMGAVIEAGVLLIVCLSPWAFGAVEPELEFVVAASVAFLIVVWAARIVVAGRLDWARCPVLLCLAAFFLLGIFQLVPLPERLLDLISPSTATLYHRLLPTEPEVLPSGVESPLPPRTLSLYPAATRRELVQLLGLILLFALVRNNIASSASLRRLSLAALINGSLLAYLGLAQAFSSAPNVLYWTYESPGRAFGPFINRNHFAFYVNLSIGLGVGLLLYMYAKTTRGGESARRSHSRSRSHESRSTRGSRYEIASAPRGWMAQMQSSLSQIVSDLWGNPPVLWISAALALMITSSVFCLSRGGFLALLAAAFICVSIRLRSSPRFLRLEAGLMALTMAVGLLIWFGIDEIEKRLGTIWSGVALEESRSDLWRDGLKAARHFPFFGSGYGTFQDIEPLHRSEIQYILNQYAHNEYLEALVEGGVLRLGITLLAIALVFRLGYRAIRRNEMSSVGGLVLGALAAWSTLVLHSVGEFGVHVPAIAVFGTVIGAQLCGVANERRRHEHPAGQGSQDDGSFVQLRGPISLIVSVVLVLMGWSLFAHEQLQAKVQLFRRAADRAIASGDGGRADQLAYLSAAAGLAPDFARLHVELARAHLDAYETETERLDAIDESDEDRDLTNDYARVDREHLYPALESYLDARAACPLLGQPHVRIAAQIDEFQKAEPRTAYLDRAKLLVPWDPELWYICGVQELLDGEPERAWASWRRSLELDSAYFQQIVDSSVAALGAEGIIEYVLPDKPDVVLDAATHLFPKLEQKEERRPFLARAQLLFDRRADEELTPEDLYVKALVLEALEQWQQAEAAFRTALSYRPSEIEWRFDLAQMLYQQKRIDDAHRELVMILRQQPQHGRAAELYSVVSRIRAER